jgi:GxxExxY protein
MFLPKAALQSSGRSQFLFSFAGGASTRGPPAPLVAGGVVLVEFLGSLSRVRKKQMLTYLKLSHLKHGLLINFGGELLNGNIERLENELGELAA